MCFETRPRAKQDLVQAHICLGGFHEELDEARVIFPDTMGKLDRSIIGYIYLRAWLCQVVLPTELLLLGLELLVDRFHELAVCVKIFADPGVEA